MEQYSVFYDIERPIPIVIGKQRETAFAASATKW